ncbi:MAG TPA: hypothetical protein DHV51_02160 [Opitutae bacterium]|nr:hypothetical protein [Opitutae bacterium]
MQYAHLTQEERIRINVLLSSRKSCRAISRQLKRSESRASCYTQ